MPRHTAMSSYVSQQSRQRAYAVAAAAIAAVVVAATTATATAAATAAAEALTPGRTLWFDSNQCCPCTKVDVHISRLLRSKQ